jgi:hypothetical protein
LSCHAAVRGFFWCLSVVCPFHCFFHRSAADFVIHSLILSSSLDFPHLALIIGGYSNLVAENKKKKKVSLNKEIQEGNVNVFLKQELLPSEKKMNG